MRPRPMARLGILFEPRWRATLFLAAAAALNYADRAAMSTVLPALRTDLGLGDAALGMLGSVFLWSYALSSIAAGAIADRWSRRHIVALSLFLWSLVTVLTGLANGYPMLLWMRVGLGLSESLYLPAAIALLADYHPSATRGRAIGLHNMGLNLGVVVGGSFAGFLAEHFGWRSSFLVLGGAGIALAAAAGLFLPAAGEARPAAARVPAREAFRYLVGVPTFYVLLLKAMLVGVGTWTFFNWLPLYFRDNFNMSLGAAGFVGTFMLQISTVIGIAGGGWLSDKVAARDTRRRLFLQSFFYFLCAPFLLLFLTTPGFAVVAVAISMFSLLRGLGQANEHPVLCDIVPAQFRSTAVGIMNTCASAAGGLGVLTAGLLKAEFGLNTIFACITLVFTLSAGILYLAYRVWLQADTARATATSTSQEH
ncbi:MAG: MFS transporter [Opitutaceae bacterium]|nr:MFS transporter [Opitutaceae bacterium]